MREYLAIIAILSSSAAIAGDMGGRSHPHRIWPNEITTYRSGTVEFHLAANRSDGGYSGPSYGGSYGSGHGVGGVDGYGSVSTAVGKMRSDWGWGGNGKDYSDQNHSHSGSGGTAGTGGGFWSGGGWGWD